MPRRQTGKRKWGTGHRVGEVLMKTKKGIFPIEPKGGGKMLDNVHNTKRVEPTQYTFVRKKKKKRKETKRGKKRPGRERITADSKKREKAPRNEVGVPPAKGKLPVQKKPLK